MRISLTVAFIVSLSACTCVDTVMTQNNCTSGRCADGGLAGDGGVRSVDGGGSRDAGVDAGLSPFDVVSLEVTPAVVALSPPVAQRMSQSFTAKLVRRDGSKVDATSVTWSQDTLVAGDIDPNTGLFTTNGLSGAMVTITGTVIERGAPVAGTAKVNVTVQSITVVSGTPTDTPMKFRTLEPAGPSSANIAYPLDNVVMPQNVFPVDVQWLQGVAGDLFRVTLSKSNMTITGYLSHTGAGFMNHWLVDQSAWRALAQTNTDEPAVLRVDRWVAATGIAVASAPIHIKFAKAALSGSIYFWGINEGRIFRIDDGTNVKVNFMPKPPVMNEPSGTSQCVGCHAVSPSGRYMAGRMGGGVNFGTVFDLTADLTTDPPPSLFPTDKTQWWFSTWNPSETRLMVSTGWPPPTRLMLLNPQTGEEIVPGGAGLPSDNPAHAVWSPDGTAIAYVRVTQQAYGDWGVDYRDSDLNVLPVTGGADSFGAPATILRGVAVPGRGPEQRSISYPGWTPDSKRLVFAQGFSARSSPTDFAPDPRPGLLYMVNKDGTNVVALSKATTSEPSSYEPRFSPFDSGGYFWLAFLSRRDYGNEDNGSRGSRVAQIWISAIKKNVAPGEDPSEVGYWMTGQNPKSASISAYWAPRACRATGIACGVGSECCSGDCRPPATGGPSVCSPPPPDRCRIDGQTCGGTGECCAGLTCEQSVCRVPIL